MCINILGSADTEILYDFQSSMLKIHSSEIFDYDLNIFFVADNNDLRYFDTCAYLAVDNIHNTINWIRQVL